MHINFIVVSLKKFKTLKIMEEINKIIGDEIYQLLRSTKNELDITEVYEILNNLRNKINKV